jgi:hypothetical protein
MVNRLPVQDRFAGAPDLEISRLLSALGFGREPEAAAARRRLEEANLTRPGKVRISSDKVGLVAQCLNDQFALVCGRALCTASIPPNVQLVIVDEHKCRVCGGSDKRRACLRLRKALQTAGRHQLRLIVVGGAPRTSAELASLDLGPVTMRSIFGDRPHELSGVRADIAWADLLLVWSATELAHKVSVPYVTTAQALGVPIITCPRRGVAALVDTLTQHVDLQQSHEVLEIVRS